MVIDMEEIKQIKIVPLSVGNNCPFCKGNGIAAYWDIRDITKIEPGKYTLGELCNKWGECPEGCKPMN